jgi:hypothetical protein
MKSRLLHFGRRLFLHPVFDVKMKNGKLLVDAQ